MNLNNSRWWETYFVRYITGTVVGSVIVYIILEKLNIHWFPELIKMESSNLVILAALGFAYCYIASAPITLLHAARAYIDDVFVDTGKNKVKNVALNWRGKLFNWIKHYWFNLILLLFITLFGALLGYVSNPITMALVAVSMFVPAYAYMVAIKLYFKVKKNKEWMEWYFSLARKRASTSDTEKEFVESYRHLREHGNAFFIIGLEISFGIVLFQIASLLERYPFENKVVWVVFVLIALLYWILPGAFCWYLGNKLESHLINKP